MENSIQECLLKLGLSELDSIKPYFPRVRDSDDISVLKCHKSGVLFLSSTEHMSLSHYEEKPALQNVDHLTREQANALYAADDERRIGQIKGLIANKQWLDIGSGSGGILDLSKSYAAETTSVEPQKLARDMLLDCGYQVSSSIDELTGKAYDVITLFHVFEHMTDPLNQLKKIKKLLKPGGTLIIEVPHANDFLISFLDLDEFKQFSFWSEHLILHTRLSLMRFLEQSGFSNIIINGIQRYSLANHLYWLKEKKPGGHKHWSFLSNTKLDSEYESTLQALDMTDTLYATARCEHV